MDTDEILDEDFDEGSDEADNEFLDPSSTQPSSGPPSTPNSCTSSPPVNSEEPISPHRNFYTSTLTHGGSTLVFSSGKPYGTKRGPGRPRKEFPFGIRTVKEGKFGIKRCRGGITKMSAKKRFLGKDEKNALFNLSQEGFYTMGPKSPSDAHSGDQTPENEKAIQQMEELPYFPERWPGKLCALCNLGERSQLGQGEMLRLEVGDPDSEMQVTPSPSTAEEMELNSNETGNNSSAFPQFSNRRQKGLNKCKNPVNTSEYVDELEKVGHFEIQEFSTIQDVNYYYVHRSCATWSFGVLREPTGALEKIAQVVSQSLRRKCSYCNHYGASIACKMSCPKFFHFPCVSASGGFQIIQTYVSFCKEHLGQVPLICSDDINCRSCSALGDVSNLVMCSICGDHYHGTCIGLPQLPGVRAGWQCMSCRKCQICRVPDSNEGRSLGCEQCHKVYHANCLRPIMSSIPKFGWKCRRCRVCSDCGSRTPGAGASSRWHAHYTVCDSCYQQRNKGFSCPICHRAYRAAAHREMVKCSLCNKFVHSTCDSEAELSVYHAKKLNNPDYDYVCPPCKSLIQSGRMNQSFMRRNSHLDEDNAMSLQESTCSEEADMDLFEKSSDFGLGKGKPFSATKIAKKRMGLPFGQLGRTKGKLNFQKRPRLAEFGRKRGPKSKMRGIFGVPGLGLQRPTVESYNSKNDEEPGVENRLVLCSAKDKFILTQDICVMCGAIGTDHEGCLISCTQCGQCYHPYCVNVKVTKVILSKGWRCLDCTVCEGCGQKNDESRLILCDECDISFHIYCMDPPLDYVPQGNWKCKWCAVCQKCGRNSPGRNSSWKNSYSECGPCSSQASCAVCTESYADAELIIQCQNCEKWLHCKCDSINNEVEAEKCDEQNYSCILCRPKDVPPPHLLPPKKPPVIPSRTPLNPVKTPEDTEVNIFIGMDGTHFMDGVCLSEHGLNLIKSLRMEYIRKKRKQKLPQELQGNNKDAGILAAIESVVAGSAVDQALDDVKIEPLDPKEEAEIYKDGMVWERSDSSPPEGFALCTNEQGVVVLRKKRQRNLQKLGIGGFNVRNRAVKREGGFKDDIDEHGENVVSFVGANDNNLPIEKKRKPLRKKQKSKLIETYPAYLQEAFFGKNLLDTNKTNFESDSSDDDAKSSVSEDKIIKLSPEELKILDSMKQAQKQNVVLPSKESPMNEKNIKSIQPPVHVPSMEEDADNAEADALKDIIPQDLLDSDLVNSIINDSDELSKTNDAVSDNTDISNRKDDLTDILCPSFNLESIGINSKDVEEIFQGVIDTDTKPTPLLNQPHQTIMSPTSTTYSNNSTDLQYVSDSTSIPEPKSIPANLNNFLAVQEVFANNPKPMEQNRVPPPSVLNQGYIATNESQTSTGTNPPLSFGASQVASSWASSSPNQRPILESSLSGTDEMLGQVPVPQTTCTQKSSERMRKDEELGEMATISAVLYANTNHPELKQEFPNWTDRCKQIYKKWRSLSNEKKAPFLQQARDNRSALRMKKVQQDQEKITSQQKSLKEQEQERQWKQLQALRAKEQQLQQFTQVPRDVGNPAGNCTPNMSFTGDQSPILEKRNPYASIPGTPRPQFSTDIVQPTVYAGQLDTFGTSTQSLTLVDKNRIPKPPQECNKQLRDLLQRQEDVGLHTQNRVLTVPQVQDDSTVRWGPEDPNLANQTQNFAATPFREPFPVTGTNRNTNSVNNPSTLRIATFNPGMPNAPRPPFVMNKAPVDSGKRMKKRKDLTTEQESDAMKTGNGTDKSDGVKQKMKEVIPKTEIPEIVTAELEKLEQEENVVIGEVEGVGDILGGLGEDDDDELLNSLTAEMGADFNILEYADPELDALTEGDNHNLLDGLDFDEGDAEEKMKKSAAENKFVVQRTDNPQMSQQMQTNQMIPEGAILKNRNEFLQRKDPSLETQQSQDNRQGFVVNQPTFGTMNRVMNVEAMPQNKPTQALDPAQYRQQNVRYNPMLPQGTVCKISRANLPPPPPPYPGPPPPYPANSKNVRHHQEQPLLLEDLLEQEKREQQQQQQQQMITQSIDKKTITTTTSGGFIKTENLVRGGTMAVTNWRGNTAMEMDAKVKKEMVNPPLFNANLQPPPPLPPENIITDQDRILQINYEQWLNNQNMVLTNQLKFYEEEVAKLRKIRKSLNSKQRLMKKTGGELSPQDAIEFTKVSSEQAIIQKHLENSRKQCRQHALLLQDYKSKHLSKLQMSSPNIQSPAQINPLSPMLSPSTNSQPSLLMQTSPSPLGSHMLQSTRSPLQSPSPLLAQSPGGISQSPVHQSNSSASPYHTMQSSPRIGTPHSQHDENSFSPSATVPSPSSLPARHASPAPRITSPQHRISSSQLPQRVATSPINSYNPMMSSQQQSKFNSPQVHQDRSRMQMGNQQHLHQAISPLGSPQPIVSPNQVHSYGHNTDLMQTQRTMHFIQQRQQIIQRQQANQNVLNQAMAKAKNHPASSPVHNQSNIPSPSSPLLQYNPQQNNSILINTLSNKRGSLDSGMIENYAMLNSSPDQYLNQCRDNSNIPSSESQVFSRSNSDSGVGGGGGLSSMSGNFLPITSHFGRFGRIKLGLFGGSPMWNISSVQKRVSDASSSDITKPRSCSTNDLIKEKDLTPKSKPPEVLLSSDAPKGEDGLGSSVEVNEVVVIDSSPDEKQGIIDYDDYQDKAFIAPEVSLNSAAQNLADGDDMTVIEKFAPSELADIVSSPLESEVAEEYVLFSTDVVDYVDSDDSLKQNSILQKSDDLKCDSSLEESMSSKSETTSKSDEKSESHDVVLTSTDLKSQKLDMMETKSSGTGKPGEGKNFATTEDFEAMIDRRSTPKDDESSSPTPTPVSISVSVAGPIATTATVAKTVLPASSIVATGLICNRIPLTSVCGMLTGSGSSTTTAPTTVVMTSKKIVTDVTQTTAKVSIGNTTISVPLLKTMTLNSSHIISSEKQAQGAGNVSIQKQPTILNVRGQKLNPGTIVSLSSLQLKPSANTKIVQATVVGKKLHIPQTTSDNLNSIKQNLMHTFSYPKLSSLTVLQDMALPNKIFEDESISPESSVEQEDAEMKPIDIKEATSSKKESMADDEKSTDATDGPSLSSAVGTSIAKQVEKADEKKKEEQPVPKSDTSQELQKISTRIIPIMPQLSPLSQPTEMTTNMANVSQQLRSIMSSINSASITVEQQKTTGTQDDKQVAKPVTELKVEVQQAPKAEDKETKPSQAEAIATSTPTQTMVSRPTSANTVKVFLTTSSSNTSQFAGTLNCDDNKTLITPKTKVVVPTSMFSSVLPSTIVMTSIPHVPAKLSENSLNNSGGNSCSSKDSFKQIIPAQVSISHLKRSKSTDDGIERELPAQITGAKRYSLEVAPVKIESPDNTEDAILSTYQMAAPTTSTESSSATSSINKQSPAGDQSLNGCKTSTVTMQQPKSDESQNVLLKQLLQNSGTSTATVASSSAIQGRKVPGLRAPSLGVVSSLEAQLARPVIPPVPTNTPSLLQAPTQSPKLPTPPEPPSKTAESEEPIKKTVHIVARETSFISNPAAKSASSPADEKPPSAMEKPSGQTSNLNQDGVQMRQIFREEMKTLDTITVENLLAPKREITESPTASSNPPIIFIDDKKFVKKEICESPPIKRSSSGTPVCNNYDNSDMLETKDDKIKVDSYESNVEIKKKKKREYQKNRRQMQMLNKEVVTHTKKRPRKLSKLDEDYDNFIDNLMVQLRQMPPLQVLEPLLSRNYGICPPYGAGDLSKLGYAKENSPSSDFLEGEYGCAKSSNHIDYYNTKPFGDLEMPLEPHSAPMHNGFYDQEFPPIKFETETDQLHRFDSILKDRDIDTPESIVTSSSPECVLWDSVKPFPGLRVINEDMNDDCMYDRMSPVVPVIAPTPIKLQSGIDLSLDKKTYDNNKENTIFAQWKNKNGQTQPAKDSNVTVTLTLTSSAAEDIMGVLRDLANILHIPPPTSYQIVERTTTPPSQKLGLYRTKGKDGKEGDPIDIQTILNGAAKFCRHCDVVILNTIIRAKACEFPLLTSNNDLINNSDELYFCSKSCYKQFKWRPTNIIDDNSTSNMDFTSNSSMDSLSKFDTSSGSVGQSNKTIKQETSYDNNNLKRSQSMVEEASHRIKLNKSISMQSGCGAAGGDQQSVKKSMSDSFKPNEFINKRYKYFSHNAFTSPYKYKKPSEKEVNEMLFRMNITVTPISKVPEDTRRCIFCSQSGDGVADGPSRLLNFDVDKWVHLNCALWSDGVYETVNGALMNLEAALQASLNQSCTLCHRLGATIKCFKNRCGNMYHLSCAIKDKCIFYKDKTTHCLAHALKNEKESELTTLSVQRRVYVDRDESRQVAAVMHHSESSNLLRVGSLIFLNVGQLLSHQLQAFHTPNYIYPIGYKIIRFYWSMRRPNKRCRYICSIADVCGRPEFRVLVQEPSEDDIELRDSTPKAVWQRILEPMALLRKNHELVQLFPKYVTGEDIFGLTEPAVVRILESLPGIETLTDYRFKYGRNPLLELPLAINPSGAARTEPKQKQAVGWRKPHTQRSGSTNQRLPLTPTTSITGEVTCPYSKQFVHSKSSQYKKMKQEWRNNVFLARSKIQGLGLYAARDLEKHTMVIEYIGEVIRVEVSELREKQYEARNRGIYMFRLDEERVVDATLSGGLARYINHSCNPNCVTEIVEVDREYRIIIFAKRRIIRGEELSYDYKFDIEDDAHKISCMCGAPNCRKWMN